MVPPITTTAEYLREELCATEKALSELKTSRMKYVEHEVEEEEDEKDNSSDLSHLVRLGDLSEDLLLAKDVSSWISKERTGGEMIKFESEQCEELGRLLRRHDPKMSSSLYANLYQGEFLPLVDFLQKHWLHQLRTSLRESGYPSFERQPWWEESQSGNFQRIVEAAEWWNRLHVEHGRVLSHVSGGNSFQRTVVDDLILEFCRPIVERIHHHFILQTLPFERLLEWLFLYLKQHVFVPDGPWDFIQYGLTPILRPDLSTQFVNEILRLIQWVLDQHHFFRLDIMAGKNSKPLLLCNAIEQVLLFDDFILQLTGKNSAGRVLSLMDIFVTGDDELYQWWMDREREAVVDSLFHGKVVVENYLLPVAPRAELFCSILRSLQRKASIFKFSGPYLNQVVAPFCMQFLDAVHDSATDLKDALFHQRKLPTASSFQANILAWIELVNGTKQSAQLLLSSNTKQEERFGDNDDEEEEDEKVALRSTARQDMLRFGQSLERLQQVLIDEFTSSFVETLLMEKAKLASYLMRCYHILGSAGEEDGLMDASPEMVDVQYILDAFLEVVREDCPILFPSKESRDEALYASRALRDGVLTLLSDKFLEVALDWNGTTPVVYPWGGEQLAATVNILLGDMVALPVEALRLLDVVKCLSMDSSQFNAVGGALCGLAGQTPPLTEDLFAMDDRVLDEAVSMIRAKNLAWISLADFLSILNRRKDLCHIHVF